MKKLMRMEATFSMDMEINQVGKLNKCFRKTKKKIKKNRRR
jgi:hypothetical protein